MPMQKSPSCGGRAEFISSVPSLCHVTGALSMGDYLWMAHFRVIHRAALCGQACVARIVRVPGIQSSGLAWAANCAPSVHGGFCDPFLALCEVCRSVDRRMDQDDSAVSDTELQHFSRHAGKYL